MGGSDGTRAVSEVMGAILVFSLLVLALGAYQAVIVPNQNEQVEFKHNQEVQQDFIDLRNSVHRSATSGEDTSAAVDVGVSYPVRALTLNPPEQGGNLQGVTTGAPGGSTQDLAVENATAVTGEINDYWNGSTKNFTTGRVVYAPSYSIYRNAPRTVIENGIIYNEFEDGEHIPLSGQRVVSGREISLVAIESELSTSQVDTTAVDVNAVSGGTAEIAVTNASGSENVTIRIPTSLSEEVWVGQLLNDQIDGADSTTDECSDFPVSGNEAGRFIHDCTYNDSTGTEFNVLTLEMERGETYTVQLSKVSVGKPMAAPGPHYIVPLEGENVSVPEGGKQRLVLQVRDRFNNPVSGTTVNLSLDPASQGTLVIDGKSGASFSNVQTNEEGKIFAAYDAPTNVGGSPVRVDVEASYSVTPGGSLNASTRENATFDLRVINASKINRTGPLFNSPDGIVITNSNFTDANCDPGGGGGNPDETDCQLNVVLENNADTSKEITKIRYTFAKGDTFNEGGDSIESVLELQPSETILEFKGGFTTPPNDITFDASETGDGDQETLEFHVCKSDCGSDDEALNLREGDWFVIEIIVDGEETKTFFFSPSDGD